MAKVCVKITNSDAGLHKGHEAVIQYAKQFGDVTVEILENLRDRNRYLETGHGTSIYPIEYKKLKDGCDKLSVGIEKPLYIQIPEETRLLYFDIASKIANESDKKIPFLTERYKKQAICSIMYGICRKAAGWNYDKVVYGPEVMSFFYKAISSTPWGHGENTEIYPYIVKDEDGLKLSTRSDKLPFKKNELKSAINASKNKYHVGRNDELVQELNQQYPTSIGWRWYEILVYENSHGSGRIEITSVSYVTSEGGLSLFDESEYYE